MLRTFIHKPQTTFARKVIFQIHLWGGLALGLYAFVIGVSGSALVFEHEIWAWQYPQFYDLPETGETPADPAVVIRNIREAYPGFRVGSVNFPIPERNSFLAYPSKDGRARYVFAHPVSGHVLGELPDGVGLRWFSDLHLYLLAGRTGLAISGVAAGLLGVLCLTGLFVWWPGAARWTRALVVDFHRGWKRINWDLHSVLGFWLAAVLLMWAVSGVYIAFPAGFRRGVNAVSPLTAYIAPVSDVSQQGRVVEPDANTLVARARQAFPRGQPVRYVMPFGDRSPVLIVMATAVAGDSDSSDEVAVYFDRYSGELLEVVPDVRRSAGDVFMAWLFPLHAGWFGGVTVKTVWVVLGLAFPALFVTGTIMWWNRVVSERWLRRRRSVERVA